MTDVAPAEHTGPVLLSGVPPTTTPVPAAVAAAAAGETVLPVWLNELGGRTFQLGSGSKRRFAKWSPTGGIDLRPEAAKLRWAAPYVTVPPVLTLVTDDAGSLLLTEGLPGENAVTDRWRNDPATAVTAIAVGLRELHDTAPVEHCPFRWSVADRLHDIDSRADTIDPGKWHDDHRQLTFEQARNLLADPPPIDRLVVCHGDACAPNTLLTDDGRCSGRVDLGGLGVADRWADLAIATWSTRWNYGPDWERPLLEAYGVEPDAERTDYYRLLWDLGP